MEPADVARLLDRRLKDGRPVRFVWLRRLATDDDAAAVRALKLPGVNILTEFDRRYPRSTALAHVLGTVDVDDRGGEGLEKALDRVLIGVGHVSEVEVDGRRRKLEYPGPSEGGADVTLTIDGRFQGVVEEELDAACGQFHPTWATVVALDPRTGAVLAMACRPGFDANDPSPKGMAAKQAADARRNRSLTDPFEPGSTFKPFVVAAALEEGLATPAATFDCEMGLWKYGSRTLHDHHPFGILSVTDVVARSSNIGAIKIGMKLGRERTHRYLRAFGFGDKTGIDLPGEGVGIVHPLSKWSSYSMSSLPMGHEIGVTSIQLASAMGALANGGRLMKPHVVKRIGDGPETAPAEIRRVVSGKTADQMRAILAEVMKSGTGRDIKVDGLTLAGKTGTTQKVDRHGNRFGYISSFVGFAPVENPRIVIAVVMDEPQGAYYGAAVAAPVFGNILRRGWVHLRD
jgi:cell division protein FtsI (penicillin-binding protein 3)